MKNLHIFLLPLCMLLIACPSPQQVPIPPDELADGGFPDGEADTDAGNTDGHGSSDGAGDAVPPTDLGPPPEGDVAHEVTGTDATLTPTDVDPPEKDTGEVDDAGSEDLFGDDANSEADQIGDVNPTDTTPGDATTDTTLPCDAAQCDDSNACNGVETCAPDTGECAPGTPMVCDDNNACNGIEACDEQDGQCAGGTPVLCDDGDACNGVETCEAATGACAAGAALFCDDDNACTTDSCESGAGCVNASNDLPCDDDDACTVDETCNEGACLGVLVDADGDGFVDQACGGTDCDDTKLWVYPGAAEICNLSDDDCDDEVDEIPAQALTCEDANDIDTDGSCDGWDGDPTGVFFSAHVVDLGQLFSEIRLNMVVDFDDEGCVGTGQLHGSTDGAVWQILWAGGSGWHDVFVDTPLRYVRAGSDDCGVHFLSIDPVCLCEGAEKLTCGQFHELSDGQCCCFKTEHILKKTPEVSGVTIDCESETGFSNGCTSTINIDVSSDGINWTTVESAAWSSQAKPNGGWERLKTSTFVDQAFTYIRGSSTKADGGSCYMDHFLCTVTVPCPGKYDCEGGDAVMCDDDDPCTIDTCDNVLGCQFETACPADDNPCTVESCVADPEPYCASTLIDCEDGELCTVDTCNPESGFCESILKPFNNPACDNGPTCTVGTCQGNACTYDPVVCVSGDPCEDAYCHPQAGWCETTPVSCNDGNPCTSDSCISGVGCKFDALTCDDGNICTVDACNANLSGDPCVHTLTLLNVPICDDDKPCTNDTCNPANNSCTHAKEACDDGVGCTVDSCDDATGNCLNDASAAGCDDGDACTDDTCSGAGCQHGPKDCNDNDKCSIDSCDSEDVGCQHKALDCDDGNACNGAEWCKPATGQCENLGPEVTCSDANPCNGVETCVPETGDCQGGTPIECDDGDGCNGGEVCNPGAGNCLSVPNIGSCPVSPNECSENGVLYGPSGSKSSLAATSDMLRLVDSKTTAEKMAIIWDLQAHSTIQKKTYAHILSDLNREATEVSWVFGTQCFSEGYRFNDSDHHVDFWWPQGMASSATGQSPGSAVIEGHNVQLVSWYHKPDEDSSTSTNKGMRLSFVRTTWMDSIRYRHLLLVEPYVDDTGTANFKPVIGHAGGIVWYKNLLYVADTGKGFRVFDMDQIMRVNTGNKNTIGYDAGKNGYEAFNYRYIVPMVNRYKLCDQSCCARFSFCAVDMSASPPRIAAGEYTDKNKDARIHSWEIDAATGKLAMDPGQDTATADALFYPNVKRMQGAVSWNGEYYISSSDPKTNWPQTPGTLFFAKDGDTPKKKGYPALPEDLHHDHFTGYLWTVTEYPSLRYVFSVHRTHAKNGCQ